MSNNALALLQAQLPANLAALMPFGAGDDLASGVSGGFPIISIRGAKWRLVEGGEEKPIYMPGTTDLAPAIRVILLKANPNVSKTFYAGAYVEGSDAKPDCTSADGIRPDADAAKPQCETCAACPHNQWGSKITPSGSKTKACADVRRVAILPSEDLGHPPILLRVPAASLADLAAYGKQLKKVGVPYSAVVTKLSFDAQAAYPKIVFAFERPLTSDEINQVVQRLGDPSIEDVIAGAMPELPATAPADGTQAPAQAPAAPRRTRAAAPAPAQVVTPAPAPVQTAAAPAPVAAQVVQMPAAPAPAPAAPVMNTGNIAADIDSALAGLSL